MIALIALLEDKKMARSPSYPAISLPEAIVRLRALYEHEGNSPADREVIAQAIGYSSRNGASDAVIAALGHYGLLEETNNRQQLRISRIGLDIVLGEIGDADRAQAIIEAANQPILFQDLSNQYPDGRFTTRNVESFLVKNGFNPSAATKASRSYRETIDFVSQETASANTVQEVDPTGEINSSHSVISNASRSLSETSGRNLPEDQSEWVLPVDDDLDVRLMFRGRLTNEHIESLIEMLEVHKRRLAKKGKSQSPSSDDSEG